MLWRPVTLTATSTKGAGFFTGSSSWQEIDTARFFGIARNDNVYHGGLIEFPRIPQGITISSMVLLEYSLETDYYWCSTSDYMYMDIRASTDIFHSSHFEGASSSFPATLCATILLNRDNMGETTGYTTRSIMFESAALIQSYSANPKIYLIPYGRSSTSVSWESYLGGGQQSIFGEKPRLTYYVPDTSINTKVSGTWKAGTPHTKVSGVWKEGIAYTKVSGVWKRGY